jgi:hypothetical protein
LAGHADPPARRKSLSGVEAKALRARVKFLPPLDAVTPAVGRPPEYAPSPEWLPWRRRAGTSTGGTFIGQCTFENTLNVHILLIAFNGHSTSR